MQYASQMASLGREWERLIANLGQPATYRPAGGAPYALVVGFSTLGLEDPGLVQTYGQGARVVTVRAKDLSAEPHQFDQFTFADGESFTVDSWQRVYVAGRLAGWRGFIRGQAHG